MARLARRSGSLVLPLFALATAAGRRWPERALRVIERQVPPSDVTVLSRPDIRGAFLDDLRRSSPTTARAAAQDFVLFGRQWGFALEDIRVPVHLGQGDADRNVPLAHARAQAERIPNSVLHEAPGEGHFLVFEHLDEILVALTSGSDLPG